MQITFDIYFWQRFKKLEWNVSIKAFWYTKKNVRLQEIPRSHNFKGLKAGSLGITPTRNCNHFLKIEFVVAESWLNFYYIHQGNKSDKERKIVRKKVSFMHIKRFNTFLLNGCNSVWVQFHVYPKNGVHYKVGLTYTIFISCGRIVRKIFHNRSKNSVAFCAL